MTNPARFLCAVALGVLSPVTSFGQSGAGRLDTGEVQSAAPAPPVTAPPGKSQAGALRRTGTGTGFVIGQNLIATNFHVIDGGTAWEVRFPSTDETWPLELVLADKANDLAVMRITGGAVSPLKSLSVVTARTTRLGEDVYGVGFPLTGLLSDGHKVSTGVVSGMAGLDNDPRFFQLTVPAQPGNSGGPIFNGKGEVVGILASTLSVDYLYKVSRTVPQNVNFAIKSDYLLLLMAQTDSGTAVAQVSASGVSRVDQIADAQGSIGLVSTFAAEESRSSTRYAPKTVLVVGPSNYDWAAPQIAGARSPSAVPVAGSLPDAIKLAADAGGSIIGILQVELDVDSIWETGRLTCYRPNGKKVWDSKVFFNFGGGADSIAHKFVNGLIDKTKSKACPER